jgi:phosphonate degradation associated HDIG domain protein
MQEKSIADEIFQLFAARGAGSYFGEPVSVLEHGLQAAHFARQAGAPDTLIVAALLHDVGHLLEDVPEDIADWKTDARHEDVGSAWLARHFGLAVSEPVRLHVAAKRYLCATLSTYRAKLSPASVITLGLQGGPMNPEEVGEFEGEPFYRDAVRLRSWDEAGKVEGMETPGLEDHRGLIEAVARDADRHARNRPLR